MVKSVGTALEPGDAHVCEHTCGRKLGKQNARNARKEQCSAALLTIRTRHCCVLAAGAPFVC